MSSFLNDWFGLQSLAGASVSGATLKITDGEITISFTEPEGGWILEGPDGWPIRVARFKGGGIYTNSVVEDGQQLKHTRFDNVIENWRAALNFIGTNGMTYELGQLIELLSIRAPLYWTDDRYNKPVYIVRQLPGETNTAYALLSQGEVTPPPDMYDVTILNRGLLRPVAIAFNRQPFWLGAPPGQAQATLRLSAQQVWNYALSWAVESTLPAGQVFCMVETATGVIFAGAAAQILTYSSGVWSVVNTSPVTLTGENITAAHLLLNGDILFGGNGRIIKRSSAGVWSEETTTPNGQVHAILQVATGEIYAGDSGRILKRNTAGTWAEDSALPDGDVYMFLQSSSGRLFAGEPNRILRTSSPTAGTLEVQLAASGDSGEQYGSTVYVDGVEGDLDYFNRNYVLMRFPLAIPAGATITSTKLRHIAHRTHSGNSETVKIYVQAADNAAAVSGSANNISGRTLGTKYVDWSVSEKYKVNLTYESIDFAAVLQEYIDRPGRTSGDYAAIIMRANTLSANALLSSRREVHGWGSNPGKAPILVVSYTVPPPAGSTWEVASTLPAGNVRAGLKVGSRLIFGDNGRLLASQDDGQSFAELSALPNSVVRALARDTDEVLWAVEEGAPGRILRSGDDGVNWAVDNATVASGDVTALLAGIDGSIRASDNGNILALIKNSQLDLGQEATDENIVFVANHHKTANLTHIFIDDGGVFSSIFPATSFPFALLPTSPAVNDAIYFITNSTLVDSAPPLNLVFNIGTPARSTTSYTLAWEYWNGSAWASLTVRDGTVGLSQVGVCSVHWAMPADWATTTVNGVTGWLVRARLSALTGTLTTPTQATRNIYTIGTAFVEIGADQAEGEIESLAMLEINNRSAGGGPGGSDPPLYQNRFWLGIKPVTNHKNFRGFLNFSDENNPEGVTLSTAVDGTGATALQADTGRSAASGKRVFFDASVSGLNIMADRAKLSLATTIARDYYGRYKIFLRCRQVGGTAGQVSLRVKAVSGSGGVSALTDTQATKSTSDHHLIIFEQPLTLPVSSLYTDSDISDETALIVQISSASNSADLYLYDLFLLPIKNGYVDTWDLANNAASAVDNSARLLIDSITVPRTPIRTLAQKTATGVFKADWQVDSNGPLRVLKAQKFCIWILSARTENAGSTVWISEPEAAYSLRGWKTDRWLLGRGLA